MARLPTRRTRWFRPPRRGAEISAPPGTLEAAPGATPPTIRLIAYDADTVVDEEIGVDDLEAARDRDEITWVDVTGLANAETVQRIGEVFGLHRLALEDVLSLDQRPKVEVYDEHIFIVTRIATLEGRLETEQVSMFLGPGFVVTFQERSGDCFDSVRARIRQGGGRIRRAPADYLAYALLDAVVDHYFPLLEAYGDRLERLEQAVVDERDPDAPADLLDTRRELHVLRRVVRGLRDKMLLLEGTPLPLIGDDTRVYLRDCHDHSVRLYDDVELWIEVAANLMEMHLALGSQQLGEVTKVLTVIATIFIPLSFIAGVYGMNFNPRASAWNMPELDWTYGYPVALVLMAAVAVGQLAYFRHRGWLGDGNRRRVAQSHEAQGPK